jgi:hypothetical protein
MDALTICRNITRAYWAREDSENWAKWEQANPKAAKMLARAAELYRIYDNAG